MKLEYTDRDYATPFDSGEFAMWAVEKYILDHKGVALDIGPGDGHWRECLFELGYSDVRTVDVEDYLALYDHDLGYDLIYASHVLEHVTNVDHVLIRCFSSLKVGGVLAIAVPPCRNTLTGGHHNFFPTPFHLIYKLVIAGFDCSKSYWGTHSNDQIVVVQKESVMPHGVDMKFNQHDIAKLSHLFPLNVVHGGAYQ